MQLSSTNNTPQPVRMDWLLSESLRGKLRGWGRELERSSPRCDVQHRWTKHVESHSGFEWYLRPNEAFSQSSCTITNIKAKVHILINHYVRVKLIMSKGDSNLKRLFKILTRHLLIMKAVRQFAWRSCCLPSKRWKGKE